VISIGKTSLCLRVTSSLLLGVIVILDLWNESASFGHTLNLTGLALRLIKGTVLVTSPPTPMTPRSIKP